LWPPMAASADGWRGLDFRVFREPRPPGRDCPENRATDEDLHAEFSAAGAGTSFDFDLGDRQSFEPRADSRAMLRAFLSSSYNYLPDGSLNECQLATLEARKKRHSYMGLSNMSQTLLLNQIKDGPRLTFGSASSLSPRSFVLSPTVYCTSVIQENDEGATVTY
jgi:hypothetical protein